MGLRAQVRVSYGVALIAGKTKTLVEMVLQILANAPGSTILLCAPSNPAADTLARRLSRVLKPEIMLRLNARNRTFAEVPDEIMLYCHIDGEHFGLPPFRQQMMYRVVVCSCLDAAILHKAQATNMMIMQAQFDFLHTVDPTLSRAQAVLPHWTHLLIDEVGTRDSDRLTLGCSSFRARGDDAHHRRFALSSARYGADQGTRRGVMWRHTSTYVSLLELDADVQSGQSFPLEKLETEAWTFRYSRDCSSETSTPSIPHREQTEERAGPDNHTLRLLRTSSRLVHSVEGGILTEE